MMRVLAGDVGGTKTALALYEGQGLGSLSLSREEIFESQSWSGILPMLGEFLHGVRVDAAGFGVAGPVSSGICHTTNLPWIIRVSELQQVCGTEAVALLNDVEVAALGVRLVPPERVVWLQKRPVNPQGVVSLVSVGTGFGRAFVVPPGRAFATEAGHASLSARNIIERRLVEFLSERSDTVCIEHVLSGPGLKNIYDFVVHAGLAPGTAQLEIERAPDPSAQIGHLGLRDLDEGCAAALGLFVDLLGAELGNVALQTIPRGGLYLWGGVARKLRPLLEEGDILDSFVDKHLMRELLETIPLALLDEPELAIAGARAAALAALASLAVVAAAP